MPALYIFVRNILRVVYHTHSSPHISHSVVIRILSVALDKVELVDDIWCDVLEIVRSVAEVFADRKEEVAAEHTLDDIVRRAHHVIILVAKLDLGEHGLVDVEGLVDYLHLLASLLEVPVLELIEEIFVDVVGPVIYLEDMVPVL